MPVSVLGTGWGQGGGGKLLLIPIRVIHTCGLHQCGNNENGQRWLDLRPIKVMELTGSDDLKSKGEEKNQG